MKHLISCLSVGYDIYSYILVLNWFNLTSTKLISDLVSIERQMRINKVRPDRYQVKHESDNNNIIVAGCVDPVSGNLPPITSTVLSSYVEDSISSGFISSSSSSDENGDSSAKVVTRREMILALIARSEVEEEHQDPESEEINNNDVVEEHQHQDGSTTSDAQVEDEKDVKDGSANHEAVERKKLSWGSYLKFVTPIDGEDFPGNQTRARCDLCNKIYLRSFIRMHINNVHRHNPRVKCDVCSKEVKKKGLNRHKLKYHPSSERVNCDYCGKNILKDHLKYHIDNVHNNLRVKCDVCGKEVKVKRDGLKRHKLIHSDVDRPVSRKTSCNICGELIQQRNLMRHKRRVHSNAEKKERGRYLKFATPIDDAKKVKCNLCDSIMTRSHISHHIQRVHGSLVKCDLCGLKVKENSIKMHKLRIHKN